MRSSSVDVKKRREVRGQKTEGGLTLSGSGVLHFVSFCRFSSANSVAIGPASISIRGQSMDQLPPYYRFYRRIVATALERGLADRSMNVLVVCGGETDRKLLQELGFTRVTISNLDSRMTGKEFEPYQWSYQDAEALTLADGSFDVVIGCAGLHHCHSPHRALIEMYRVARRCVLVLEAGDGLLSRIGVRLGVVDEYELTAVVGNDCRFGGVRNTAVPNYIYRWTRREVIKTVASAAPHARPTVIFLHEFTPPVENLGTRRNLRGLILMYLAWPAVWLLTRIFPSQCNLFGFAVVKPDLSRDLFPWLKMEGDRPTINAEWAKRQFRGRDDKQE
jgi:SAM-dependent methyltransferase